MSEAQLDFREGSVKTPDHIRQEYAEIIPTFISSHPESTPQEALDHIRELERKHGSDLFRSRLSPEATPTQELVFTRKRLRLKEELGLITQEEKEKLLTINQTFQEAASELVTKKGIPETVADDLLIDVFKFNGIKSPQEAIDLLIKGPIIEGFDQDPVFHFSNEQVRSFLSETFGEELLFEGRVLRLQKVHWSPVNCPNIELGNSFVPKGAKWQGGFLVLPNRELYEEVEMKLEGLDSPDNLEHSFKLRAATDAAGGYSTIKFYEFVVEQPSHYDYLENLPISEEDKMKVFFLGIVAHEVVHTLKVYKIKPSAFQSYQELAFEEHSPTLDHKYVSKYVQRHNDIYGSKPHEVANEDLAESVRIFLTNSQFLKTHFPRRYNFVKEEFPDLKENAIQNFAVKSS